MITAVSLIITTLLAYLLNSLRIAANQFPKKELRRRARSGDAEAYLLHMIASHGRAANTLLLGASTFFASVAVVLASKSLGPWLAVLFVFLGMLLFFVPFPVFARTIRHRVFEKLVPLLVKMLTRLRPVSTAASRLFSKRWPPREETKLFEKEDLIELLQKQKTAVNNRIDQVELDIALNALAFGDKKIKDYMVPRHKVHFVESEDPIGPILLNELHNSGYSRFPVKKTGEEAIVGILHLKDLLDQRKNGIVANVMKSGVCYVNQDEPLEQVLSAFADTKHHMFLVLDKNGNITGLITLEDVFHQLLGRQAKKHHINFRDKEEVASGTPDKQENETD